MAWSINRWEMVFVTSTWCCWIQVWVTVRRIWIQPCQSDSLVPERQWSLPEKAPGLISLFPVSDEGELWWTWCDSAYSPRAFQTRTWSSPLPAVSVTAMIYCLFLYCVYIWLSCINELYFFFFLSFFFNKTRFMLAADWKLLLYPALHSNLTGFTMSQQWLTKWSCHSCKRFELALTLFAASTNKILTSICAQRASAASSSYYHISSIITMIFFYFLV